MADCAEKFGPLPDGSDVPCVLLLHLLGCAVILLVLRPPFVMRDARINLPLVLLVSVALTVLVFEMRSVPLFSK